MPDAAFLSHVADRLLDTKCCVTGTQACSRMSLYCVPLYDSLGENAIEYIVTHSEATIVFVASDKIANLAAALPHVNGQVKNVVYWGAANPAAAQVGISEGCMQ